MTDTKCTAPKCDCDWPVCRKERSIVAVNSSRSLTAENLKLRDLCERLELEAKIHAGEARGANSTIREAYRAVTNGTGEPGNWNGAGPIKKEISRLRAELAEAVELLHRMIQDFHPFTSKPMGAPYSPGSLEQDRQIVTHSAARAFLAKQGE